ncbi:biotin transporter BioY [Nocardioides campestrisoli]|uniref:biotin transporter BioY n=1 Tax=Nocardioides campestrisoli TaxID=2736757 RepID=UPI0015E752D7|nr:biotin transporter BioY [Nocardioides campestrisoli]
MSNRPRRTGTDLALVASFAALIAVCAILPAIKIGLPVGITLQTFAVLLSGAVLGARRGFLAVVLYLAVGAAGLPVFSEGRAGLGVFQGPSVGYLLAFPLAAACCGFLVERLPRGAASRSVPLVFVSGLVSSLLFVHTLGVAGMALRVPMDWVDAVVADAAFYPGDVVKNLAMAFVATAVHRAFPDLLPTRRARRVEVRETIPG